MLQKQAFTTRVAEHLGLEGHTQEPETVGLLEMSVPVEDLVQAIEILQRDFGATFRRSVCA